MSDLEDFLDGAFADSVDVIGAVSFHIEGMNTPDAPYSGVIDHHTRGQALHDEGGGLIANLAASIVAAKAQFPSKPPPNAQLTCQGVAYEIADIEDDAISYTFRLVNPVN